MNSPHKGQSSGALMFSLICIWTNKWANNGDAGDLRCHHTHYDITVMKSLWAHNLHCGKFKFCSYLKNNALIRSQISTYHHCWVGMTCGKLWPGPWFNIKMSSYQYGKSHCGDKMVIRSSYLHNGISYEMNPGHWCSPHRFPVSILHTGWPIRQCESDSQLILLADSYNGCCLGDSSQSQMEQA